MGAPRRVTLAVTIASTTGSRPKDGGAMAMSVDAVRAVAAPIVSDANLDLEDVTIEKVGRRAKVTVSNDDYVTVDVSGQSREVAYSDIIKAVVQVEFDRKKDA
jgi:diaminopimelate epimerase